MGQQLIKAIIFKPLSFRECFVDGKIDIARYYVYRCCCNDYDNDEEILRNIIMKRKRLEDETLNSNKKRRHHRSMKRYQLLVCNNDGTIRELKPTDTLWYQLYVKNEITCPRLLKLFRN